MVYTIVVHLLAKDSPDAIEKLKNKLVEASGVYSKDTETLSWFVMQDFKEPRRFTIVERYERESVSFYSYFLLMALEHGGFGGRAEGYGEGNVC